MAPRQTHLSFSAQLVRFFLTLTTCLLLAIAVYARLITDSAFSPTFPNDPAFKGSLVIPLDQTLPAKCGDSSFTMTVSGVQFSFQTAASAVTGGLFNCFPQGAPAGHFNAITAPITISINPPVQAVGLVAGGAECFPHATFVGSLGTEAGNAQTPSGVFNGFIGAADIGGISTVTLNDTCTSGSANWSEILFVPASGVPAAQADVAVNKTASAPAAGAAALLDYSIGVTNNGPDTAKSVIAADFLPPNLTVNITSPSATPIPPVAPTTLTWSLGDLAKGANNSLSVFTTTPPFDKYSCEDTLLNVAVVGASTTDPNLLNNVAFTTTPFDKASRANVPEVCNNGLDDNCNGFIDCNDPACTSTSTCNAAIAPVWGVGGGGGGSGARGGCAGNCGGGEHCPPGEEGFGCCLGPSGHFISPACCDPLVPPNPICDLERANDPNRKESDPRTNLFGYGYTQAGQTITYTIHYENIGNGDAHNVSILDPLHPRLDETTLIINNAGIYDPATRVIVWHDPLTLPPQVPRSVSFSAKVRADAQPGTRVRNRATVVFPDALVPRTDTNFVEHTIVDPQFPIVADLSVSGCTQTSAGNWQVNLLNTGFRFAYNVTAEVVNSPTTLQVSNPLVHFVHPTDPQPAVLTTVMPHSTSVSMDTVSITTANHEHESEANGAEQQDDDRDRRDSDNDVCNVLTWRIRYMNSTGEMLSTDEPPSIARTCPCAGPPAGGAWENHEAYESCVEAVAYTFEKAGLITNRQRHAILEAAEESACGMRGDSHTKDE
jgi:uncharacterized repeat protein (TIGR01451 family)